jgi:hypothetical protein
MYYAPAAREPRCAASQPGSELPTPVRAELSFSYSSPFADFRLPIARRTRSRRVKESRNRKLTPRSSRCRVAEWRQIQRREAGMFCSECGKPNQDSANFCYACGKRVNESSGTGGTVPTLTAMGVSCSRSETVSPAWPAPTNSTASA